MGTSSNLRTGPAEHKPDEVVALMDLLAMQIDLLRMVRERGARIRPEAAQQVATHCDELAAWLRTEILSDAA